MPSLYETTAQAGDVSSSDFTTLYNASGLTVPNAGAGAITGNLNVSGNLTVQGTSQLIGAVVLGNTLTLPNYTFPLPDGSTNQVMVTDGAGNLTWVDVTAIPGAAYNIEATTATGGANLTLLDSAGGTDSVKFASGTGIAVSRTDVNTITITNTAPDTNTTYTINASATTGGANFNLVGSDSTVDTIKFAGSNHTTVTRTDADTITIADSFPNGTAQGQVLYWDGSAWTANNVITSAAAANRFTLQYNNSGAGSNAILFLRKNYGAGTYTTNDGANLAFQLQSNTQATNQYAQISTAWDATAPLVAIATNINNNTTGPFVNAATFSTLQATLPGDLAVNGGDITTTQTTATVFNATPTTVNAFGAGTAVTMGATSGTMTLRNPTIVGSQTTQNLFNTTATTVNAFGAATALNVGANSGTMTIGNPTVVGTQTTQNLFNTTATTVNAFGAATAINMGAATGTTTIGHDLSVNGQVVKINADNTAADSYLYYNGTTEYLKWDLANSRFELSDQLYITQTDTPAVFERRVTTAEVSPSEAKGALRLLERVTDAANNNTDDAGPAVVFGRTSGATDATERTFASMGSVWYGTQTKAKLQFNWSTDNYTETTPGVFPQTYTLLSAGSDNSTFFNNSLFIDYANVVSTKTATSITGGNTLVFGSAHGYTAGQRLLYQTATTNGLTQSTYYYVSATGLTTTQCQVSNQSGGSSIPLTNGTGLTLTFAIVSNQVGVNTATPNYTLDVNGDGNFVGPVTVEGVKLDLTTPVVQGQLLYVSNDVTPTITNSSTVIAATAAARATFQYDNSSAGPNAALFLRKNYGAGTYTTNDGANLAFQLQSNSQAANQYAQIVTKWNATAPVIDLQTGIAGGVAGPYNSVGTFTTAQATLPGDLAVNGGDITTTQTTANVFNTTATTVNAFGAATAINIGANTGTTTINNDVDVIGNVNGTSITIDDPRARLDTGNSATWATGTTITLSTTGKNVSKCLFYISDNTTGAVHTVEALALRIDATTAKLTTYAEMYSGSALATFTADVSSGSLRIRGTSASANTLTVSIIATTLL